MLNSIGVSRSLNELLQDKDIDRALEMMQEHDTDVDIAISEYNPQTHPVMKRPNKYRKKSAPYISEKLPRCRQRYINEVELFFLFGRPIVWKMDEGSDEAFKMFIDFMKEQHFNSRIRQAKRLAGAETESAKLYHIYRDETTQQPTVKSVVLARATGYKLRPLIDQFGNMVAFAYEYTLREGGRNIRHCDFQTPQFLIYGRKANVGWDVQIYPNPTGKINLIYYKQPKSWDGVEPRLVREENLDSKVADANNYFSDPIATATADVINSLSDPSKPGQLIQLTTNNSKFEYINPPQSSELRRAESEALEKSILFDTYTPDFSFEALRGMGSLSGVAIRNAMVLGYIKRDNRKEIYGELIQREVNLVKAILKYLHPDKAADIDALSISFEFGEPFTDDQQSKWQSIGQLYKDGLISLEQAVTMLGLTDAPKDEIERIKEAATDQRQQPPSN